MVRLQPSRLGGIANQRLQERQPQRPGAKSGLEIVIGLRRRRLDGGHVHAGSAAGAGTAVPLASKMPSNRMELR